MLHLTKGKMSAKSTKTSKPAKLPAKSKLSAKSRGFSVFIFCVPNCLNSVRDVHKSDLLYEMLMFLPVQSLRHAVSSHFIRADPVYRKSLFLNFLTQPMPMYVDMSKSRRQDCRLCSQKADCLHVVAKETDAVVQFQVQVFKQTKKGIFLLRGR